MFKHVLRNKAGFSGNNNFVKKWQKSAPKTVNLENFEDFINVNILQYNHFYKI